VVSRRKTGPDKQATNQGWKRESGKNVSKERTKISTAGESILALQEEYKHISTRPTVDEI
jgi:hypothetical protein